jgi:hypothetical protein
MATARFTTLAVFLAPFDRVKVTLRSKLSFTLSNGLPGGRRTTGRAQKIIPPCSAGDRNGSGANCDERNQPITASRVPPGFMLLPALQAED